LKRGNRSGASGKPNASATASPGLRRAKRPHIRKPPQLRFLDSTWGDPWLAGAAAGRKARGVHQGDDE
jgi:hypothetical protein